MAAADQKKLLAQLDQTRTKISGIKTALAGLDRQPIAPSDVTARVDAVIASLAERLDSDWLGQVLAGAEGPSDHEDVLEQACHHRPSMGVLLAWLHPDLLRERLVNLATEYATGTIPLADRPAHRQELEAELYRTEVEEERIVVACEESGLEVFRRPDADPSIILSLET